MSKTDPAPAAAPQAGAPERPAGRWRLAAAGLLTALLASAGLAAGLWWLGAPAAALLFAWLDPPGRRGWTAFTAVLAAWVAFDLRALLAAGGWQQSQVVMALAGLPGPAAVAFWLLPALLAAAAAGLAAVAGAEVAGWRRGHALGRPQAASGPGPARDGGG
ncbi:MAG: hypothetical protein QJR14_01550 [Bacillota bacterium]|nr:hypothetical protein [Bacillota bacterium]